MHQHSSLLHALAIRETGCCTLPAAIRRAVSGNVDTLHRLVLQVCAPSHHCACFALPQRWLSSPNNTSPHNTPQHTLVGHEGCVNTVAFNQTGDILLSGSDDLSIILWQWREQRELLQYDSGHTSNVFQARALPHTNTSAIVTCARDGHIRLGRVAPDGTSSTSSLGRHRLAAHKLALDQQPQCVYSCGEDGKVMHLDTRAAQAVQTQFCCKLPALTMHNTVCGLGVGAGVLLCDWYAIVAYESPVALQCIILTMHHNHTLGVCTHTFSQKPHTHCFFSYTGAPCGFVQHPLQPSLPMASGCEWS